MRIVRGDFGDPQVVALLDVHVTTARAKTAHGSAHALDLTALQSPDIAFWTTWEGEILLGCGALKRLSATHGELKSMHTAQAARRRGAGAAMLAHLIAEARAAGLTRLSLETGAWDFFIPARALYARHGFVACAPFEGYKPDPNSVFMTQELGPQA
ncbi:GNAT family N-acetyltransferase [Sphingomonas abietis]|uniref:GNAT family N-acetyltransferase n=1 Tax=Sphingomonas abietis TaxID=3012344 RepID=A0ABY7NPQ4_9SPHN|nr:GNAT family N-acetyltransferase [Sphingomonas abietis]WBO23498.1 GNAT family N-acetyltransferase [Sphingomonas abietis]